MGIGMTARGWIAALLLAIPAGAEEAAPVPGLLDDAAHGDWRAIGRVNVGGYRLRGLCTGTLVAPDLVLTAAHCVPAEVRAEPGRIHFLAGWLRGGFAAHRIAQGFTPFGEGGSPGDDLLLIRLAAPIGPADVTPLPMAAPSATAPPYTLVAYGDSHPHALRRTDDCDLAERTAELMGLTCEAVPGNSGAPLLARVDGRWHVVAVMTAQIHEIARSRSLAVVPPARLRRRLAGE